jgi:hypothetical protein
VSTIRVRHHVIIRDPQDMKSSPHQHIVAQTILGLIMRIAVNFDD